jgi:hypothetical protein
VRLRYCGLADRAANRRPFDEATVLRVGHAYERATEWHLRRPVETE